MFIANEMLRQLAARSWWRSHTPEQFKDLSLDT